MSEEHPEAPALPPPRPDEAPPAPAEAAPAGPDGTYAVAPPPRRDGRTILVALAAIVVLVVAGVAASPFWAPAIMPLLPWSAPTSKIDLGPLEARIAALEHRPTAPAVDLTAVETAEKTLSGRVDQLGHRIDALEGQSKSQAAAATAEIGKLRDEAARLGTLAAGLGDRLTVLEQKFGARAAADRKEAAMLVLLLQIRGAIERDRPFAAEYDAVRALAQGDPDSAKAIEPLVDAAAKGVASRAALTERLHALAGAIATAAPPPAPNDWEAEALARMRKLVTVRHIGGAAQTGPEAAVTKAEAALARGDLGGAATALGALSGAPAEAAAPWLELAHGRLVVEAALDKLQQMLATRLGAAPAKAPAKAASPS